MKVGGTLLGRRGVDGLGGAGLAVLGPPFEQGSRAAALPLFTNP